VRKNKNTQHNPPSLRKREAYNLSLRAILGLCFLLAACSVPPPPPAPAPLPAAEIWPTSGWTFSTPEAQGIDSDALAYAVETIRQKRVPVHSVFLERNGAAVLDAYFFPFPNGETHNVASVTKSVVSTLIGIAEGPHRLGELDRPIFSLLPELANDNPRKQRITLSELLSMTSGLDCRTPPGENLILEMEHSPHWTMFAMNRPVAWEPGTTFEYCGGGMHLVSAALTRATGESAFDLARRNLFAPLGIARAAWPADPDGVSRGFADLELQPRDAAKLGYLWLRGGRWEDRQIIPVDYLATALSPHATVQAGIQYGYGMWLYPSHVPFDFEANGRAGQRITVIPSESIVEVVTAGGADANLVAPLLAAAVKANFPLPPNDSGDARLAAAIALAARPPAVSAAPPLPAWARNVAGRTFLVSDNPLGLRSLSLSFETPATASVRLSFADGTGGDHPVGMDGVPRLSEDVASGHRVALRGWWRNNEFDLEYDEVARIDSYTLHLAPVADGLRIHLTERTGLADMVLSATPALPD